MLKKMKEQVLLWLTGGLYREDGDGGRYQDLTRVVFLRCTMLLGAFFLLVASFYRFFTGNILKGITDGLLVLFVSLFFALTWSKKLRGLATQFFLGALIAGFFFRLFQGEFSIAASTYLLAFPVISFFLQEKMAGILWNLSFLFVQATFIFLVNNSLFTSVYKVDELLMMSFSFCFIGMLSFFVSFRHERTLELIRFNVYHDPLTGLPNRQKLVEDIRVLDSYGLFLISIDDYKEIMGLLGEEKGDEVIKNTARLLQYIEELHCGRAYRYSLSEFALLCPEGEDVYKNFKALAEEISGRLEEQYFAGSGQSILIHISMGITYNGQPEEDLISCAEVALKEAKKSMFKYRFYNQVKKIRERDNINLRMAVLLKEAIDADRVFPHFQPVFDTRTGELAFYECLMRFSDKDGRIYTPEMFLDIARRTRQYQRLTRIIVRKVFRRFAGREEQFSINLSAEDFSDPYTRQFLLLHLEANKQLCSRAHFEILESESIKNFPEISRFIDAVKAMGGRIALDDFGSGYANFSYLLELDLDLLKIDGSLIKNLDIDKNAYLIVKNIVEFARGNGIKTVAEFVHSASVQAKVVELGVDYSQGFYLGEPSSSLLIKATSLLAKAQ